MSLLVDAARLSLGTLTILPVHPPGRVDQRVGGLAMVLAPLAVLPLAAACGLTMGLAHLVGAPPAVASVLAVAVLALGSGGLHLDGLADTVDGLTVPGDRDRRLSVMGSGDVGPVGAAALVLVILAQATSLAEIAGGPDVGPIVATTTLAVVASRSALIGACIRGIPAARPDGLGRAVASTVPPAVAGPVLTALVALAWLVDGAHGIAGVVTAGIAVGILLVRARRRIGGVTGDVLGACVEVALAAYLVARVLSLPT